MRIMLLFIFFFCFYVSVLSQQLPEDFRIHLPKETIHHTLYNRFSFLDSRYDTTDMGFVLTGATNRKSKVITTIPLATQLADVFQHLSGNDPDTGELLFQLRRLQFYQFLNTGNEKGYCNMRVCLYKKSGDGYIETAFTDTVLEVKATDARRPIFEKAGQFITDFIADNSLHKEPPGTTYSFENIVAIDSIEKENIPVYQAATYTDGCYKTFSSFKNMMPDGPVSVEMRDGKVDVVKTTGQKGELTKILYPKDVYAIVFNGHPYIGSNYGFYQLNKVNGDFVFTGKAPTLTSNSGSEFANRFFFGITGALFEPRQTSLYNIKVDHLTGQFVILDEIKK